MSSGRGVLQFESKVPSFYLQLVKKIPFEINKASDKKVEKAYPQAEKIILVQDNLNMHNPSSFYETFSPRSAFRLSQRLQMTYTPKKASWLNNMVEIELSTLSKQCLGRRIGDIETFSKEVYAWARQRNRRKATVSWQFTKNDARKKLNRFYRTIKN